MFSVPGSSSAWRVTFQSLQQSFRQAAEAHPDLRHAILQALDEEGVLPPSLEKAMREAGSWSAGEMRNRWEAPAGQWKEEVTHASYLEWWQLNCPAKIGYLSGDPAGRKRFEFLAERAWLALPGTPDGKAQAYPQPRALERWMAFVYRQLASAPSSYLAAEDELWVVDHAEDGHLIERRFPPRAVKQGDIVSMGYPDATGLSSRVRRWVYTALATDPFTASIVAIDVLLAHPDPVGPRLISWQEMDAFQKSPACQNANFLVEHIILANGKLFPVYRRDCKGVPGTKPSICPSAEPPPPVRLRPDGEMMAGLEKRFRELRLIGDGETIHWVGRQNTVETTCVCYLSDPPPGDGETRPEQPAAMDEPRVVLRGRDEGPMVLGKEKPPLTGREYNVIKALLDAGKHGLSKDKLDEKSGHSEARKVLRGLRADLDWAEVILMPGKAGMGGYRIK